MLFSAHAYISQYHALDRDQNQHLRYEALRGWAIVPNTARLCAVNPLLHEIAGEESPIRVEDALGSHPGVTFDMVLTNPPFGKKSSITIINESGEEDKESLTYFRNNFWVTISNKQLNFVQQVKSILKVHGRAAIVVISMSVLPHGARRHRKDAGVSTPTTNLSNRTRQVSTSSGYVTRVWRTAQTFPIPTYGLWKLRTTCKLHWSSSPKSPGSCRFKPYRSFDGNEESYSHRYLVNKGKPP